MASQFSYGSIIITFVDPGSNLTILILVIYRSSSSSWRNKNAPYKWKVLVDHLFSFQWSFYTNKDNLKHKKQLRV